MSTPTRKVPRAPSQAANGKPAATRNPSYIVFVRQNDGAWKQITAEAVRARNRKEAIRKVAEKDQGGVFLVLRERDVPEPMTRKLKQQTIEIFE